MKNVRDKNPTTSSGSQNIRRPQIDSEGFQIVEKKKKRNLSIAGSKKVSSSGVIKGAVRSADVYVGNCDLNANVESMLQYIKDEIGIEAIECTSLATRNTRCKSFKVKLNMNDREKLLSPEAWPEDVICRKFYNPPKINPNT